VALLEDGNLHFNGEVGQIRHSTDPIVLEFLERYKTKVV
jgi:ABC-type transporter Mla maintaining outer membrane lipid asymmetry ATPase subunit MlaF